MNSSQFRCEFRAGQQNAAVLQDSAAPSTLGTSYDLGVANDDIKARSPLKAEKWLICRCGTNILTIVRPFIKSCRCTETYENVYECRMACFIKKRCGFRSR